MATVERRLKVTEEAGLHARPAAAFAQAAAGVAAEVTVARADAASQEAHVPGPQRAVRADAQHPLRRRDRAARHRGRRRSALEALARIAAPA